MTEARTETADELGLEGALDRFLEPAARYGLTRFVVLRGLALVYLVAFLVAALQIVPLVGEHGLLPAQGLLDRLIEKGGGSRLEAARRLPTLFLVTGASDKALLGVAWLGVALSALVLAGVTHAGVMLVLWALYLSIVQVGQEFWSYGWEIQLCETGLLAVFLCPLRSFGPFPRSPPPRVTIWLLRWLVVRVMLGAGLIKLRGDPCWTELSCLDTHFETQPLPGPLSPFFHHLPQWLHQAGVLFTLVVEVVAPFFAFGPRWARRVAGALFVAFQLTLILSGNLSFFNWLTIVAALACFDDDLFERALPRRLRERLRSLSSEPVSRASQWSAGAFALMVGLLSLGPIGNLLSSQQAMNRSFEPLHLVNTYGAFGSVGKERLEVVLQGTLSEDPEDEEGWRDYVLPSKPGPLDRGHPWITPYQRRLDWQMWFLPFGQADDNPWFIHLAAKLLHGDPAIRPLLAEDPFAGARPVWVRATLYRYRMGRTSAWEREWLGTYLRPVDGYDPELVSYLEACGFDDARMPP